MKALIKLFRILLPVIIFALFTPVFALVPANYFKNENTPVTSFAYSNDRFCNLNWWSCPGKPRISQTVANRIISNEDRFCNLNPWSCKKPEVKPTPSKEEVLIIKLQMQIIDLLKQISLLKR